MYKNIERRWLLTLMSIVIIGYLLASCGENIAYADGITTEVGDVNDGVINEEPEDEVVDDNNDNEGPDDSDYDHDGEDNDGNEADADKGPSISCAAGTPALGRVIVNIKAASEYSGISMIQAENTAVGIRKTIYKGDLGDEDINGDGASIDFAVTANGRYAFRAYDAEDRIGECVLDIGNIAIGDMAYYRSRAEDNQRNDTRDATMSFDNEDSGLIHGVAKLGGISEGYEGSSSADRRVLDYSVRTSGGEEPELPADEKYKNWSMLSLKGQQGDVKAWFEPYNADGTLLVQPLENIIDLSDYKVELFGDLFRQPESEVLGDIKEPYGDYEVSIEGLQDGSEKKTSHVKLVFVSISIIALILSMAGIMAWKVRGQIA